MEQAENALAGEVKHAVAQPLAVEVTAVGTVGATPVDPVALTGALEADDEADGETVDLRSVGTNALLDDEDPFADESENAVAVADEDGEDFLTDDDPTLEGGDVDGGGDAETGLGDLNALDQEEGGIIEVYDKKCMRCSHLVAFAEKTFNSCHFTRGNAGCPAQTLKITLQLNLAPIAQRLLSYEQQGDAIAIAKFYKRLGSRDPWIQKEMMEEIAEQRRQQQQDA